MKIGSTFNHEVYGPLQITKKRYSRMGNKSLWIGVDENGEEHELDGTEKPAKFEKESPKFLKEAAEVLGMTQGPKGEDADEDFIIEAVIPRVLEQIRQPEDGKDGADADVELIIREMLPLVMEKMPRPKELNEALIIQRVVSRIRIPQDGKPGEKGKDGSPDTPVQVKDKLESLKGNERLDASAIKNLPKPTMQFGGDSYTGLAKVDSTGTPGTLEDKLVAGTNVTITKVNDTLRIASSGGVGGGQVASIVAGNNIDVDATDPANPIVSVETLTLADVSDITASATELNYVDGVTSAIQTQLNAKQGSITSGDTQVLFSDGVNNPAGDAGLTYNKTTDALTVAGLLTTPTIYGGTDIGSVLQLTGTSGVGTSTANAVQVMVGSNGATRAISVKNDGKVSIGSTGGYKSDKFLTVTDGASPTTTAGANGILVDMSGGGGIYMTGGAVQGKYEAYGSALGIGTMSNHPMELYMNNAKIFDATTSALKFYRAITTTNSTDSASVQVAIFEGDRATPAANDEAYISLRLSDSAGNQDEMGRIGVAASTITSGAEISSMDFTLINSGAVGKVLRLSNTSIRPWTNDLLGLGTSTVGWSDLFLASGGVINWNAGDVLLTHATDTLTLSGGTFVCNDVRITNGSGITTQATAGNTMRLGARDVDGAAYTYFITFTANNTPTCDLDTAVTIGGVAITSASNTQTLTNKRRTRRLTTTNAPGATPTTNSDNVDVMSFTGLNTAITSMTTNLSGTPVDGDLLEFRFTDDGTARGITWGASFVATTVALPTTTVISTMLRVGFEYSGSTWKCIATC